ncbi:alpha-2,8-polysialyltransferase family protein [Marinobacter hydrocarbonoclasticus]|nr:alpha-2,8-polysialyltransferase family protein [Marinobacter nauticus]
MDFYISTTPRHLLFAILRAQSRPETSAQILFFTRHLEQDRCQWQPDGLPAHITVHFLSWREMKDQMALRPWGLWMRLRNARKGQASKALERQFCAHLDRFSPGLGQALNHSASRQLLIFHDRNPIARLFVQLFPRFDLIEDGEGNYMERKLSGVKRQLRRWQGLPEVRVFGEGAKCRHILALHPEQLPQAIRHKGRGIDFLKLTHPEMLLKFFNVQDALSAGERNIVLLTQPLERLDAGSKSLKKKVFAVLSERLAERGYHTVLKIHPREAPEEYAHLNAPGGALDPRVPIEALILGADAPVTLLSVQSTAGSGFESYCRPLKMVGRQMNQAIADWGNDMDAWRNALDVTLDSGNPAHE